MTTTETTETTEDTILETESLTKRFGELVAVDEVDLAVEHGEFHSVIGPNGAGKTTLFNLLTGVLSPSTGTVRFADEDVTALAPHERVQRGIGRSFQLTTVFPGLTVRENVRLAAQSMRGRTLSRRDRLFGSAEEFESINETTDEVLSKIGLSDRTTEHASALAYGDRRRLEIGIVLATAPDLMLLDEPTAGMSEDETNKTMTLIDEMLADHTVILIEHDIDLVMRVSDRITVLDRGQIIATGTPAEVADDEDVQHAYLGGVRE